MTWNGYIKDIRVCENWAEIRIERIEETYYERVYLLRTLFFFKVSFT